LKGETFVDWDGSVAVRKATDCVWLLYQWAQDEYEAQCRAVEAKKMGELFPDDDATARVSAEQWLIGFALPKIYERHFKKFGISKPDPKTGKPFGPGIRFIQACLQEIGVDKSADAIEKHWRRSRQTMGQAH
jgi:hypothetical protein